VRVGWPLGGRLGHDERTEFVVGGENTVVAQDRVSRREDQRREADEELHRCHDDVGGSSTLIFALIGDPAVGGEAEALEDQRWSQDVTAEALAAAAIALPHGHVGV
jgi:hypothetical protein